MPRDYRLYLRDMLTHADYVADAIAGFDYDMFCSQRDARAAVERYIEIIGEAAKHVPEAVRDKYAVVDWRQAAGMRDVLANDYPSINLRVLWHTATHYVPSLASNLRRILETEQGSQSEPD
jgi:uncharacterized protein with HEPN domain